MNERGFTLVELLVVVGGGGILSPLLPWDYAEPVSALALRSMAGYADWVAEIEAVSGRNAEIAIQKCPLNQYAGLLRCARNDKSISGFLGSQRHFNISAF